MSKSKQPEVTITIPYPRPTAHLNRGHFINESQPNNERPSSIRFYLEDKQYIRDVAASLNMGFSEFVKWVAIYAARAVYEEQQRQTFDGADDKGPDLTGYE